MTDTRDVDLTYAASDFLVHFAPEGTAKPTDFADLAAPWVNLGWMTQDGPDNKMNTSTKDLLAAGTLSPIRTLFTAQTRTMDATFEEALNPAVRSLYDDVPLASLSPTSGIVAYDLADIPSGTKYAIVTDTVDGEHRVRQYGGHVMVTARGDEKVPTTDADELQMTFTYYPGPGAEPSISKLINYGTTDVSRFFS